ncbi:helix-turn-helix transcriptional regulator [Avibacterium paragallinarum]|uniref:helix-turn-helix transcriptional regulator n=1 Tax=Avibacterium TaxID=292486 RepID=UPI00021AD398|nr:helix-turn-helix domain-containing protein [Avibacterium paragallinarum]AZI13638.1 DNA-binding protein [Avibacterium paragallinarum]QIR12048.1 helix-turn-helix domain-containing protein [Avibacterium paragallinarum]QJE09132.1 helix-turn-helix domain-containing protein [Avibacterium paragallinarum]QJE11328.1 helix-turn-helix domain-containing protein [Avibacterium paragallinarum]QJE13526.1 helix-turn-helix domain-containing protein [Avibacterium paragallinarum]
MEKNSNGESRFYSSATICKMLDVSRSWLWEQTKAGNFPQPIKLGRLARYPVEAVERFIAQQQAQASQEKRI